MCLTEEDNMCIWKNKRKTYSSAIKFLNSQNIAQIREKVKILFVDDEEFEIVEQLKDRMYKIYYKSDIWYTIEAEPFDVIIMDIRGVAKRTRSSMEGFSIAAEIKKAYPEKQVYCYSGTVIMNEIAEKLNNIDGYILKDTDIDKWTEKLDTIICDYTDSDKRWEIIRERLVQNKVSDIDIETIHRDYKRIYKDGYVEPFMTSIFEHVKQTEIALNLINSVLTLISKIII